MTDSVNRAFLFALKVHGGQTRKDGKPYITHPFSVAMELAKNGASDELICAGLLHDTIEDGGVSPDELKREFGGEVLRLVLFDTENKRLSWKERKDATLLALENCNMENPYICIGSDVTTFGKEITIRLAAGGGVAFQ